MTSTFSYDSPLVYDSNQEYDAFSPTVAATKPDVLAHLAASVSLGSDGSFVFVDQDSISEVSQCVEMIVGTVIGDRTVVPTFGIPDQTFTQPNKGVIEAAISNWEPRCISNVNIRTDPTTNVSSIQVNVALAKRGVSTS